MLKIRQSKWDADNLHRHHDYAPIKKESLAQAEEHRTNGITSFRKCLRELHVPTKKLTVIIAADDNAEDEFGSMLFNTRQSLLLIRTGDEFDEADFGVSRGEHPDEVTLDQNVSSGHLGQRSSIPKGGQTMPNRRMSAQTPQQIKPATARVQTTTVGHEEDARIPLSINLNNIAQQQRTVPNDRAQEHRMEHAPPAPRHVNAPRLQGQPLPPQAPRNAPTAASRGVCSAPQSPKTRPSPNHAPGAIVAADFLGLTTHEPPVGFFTARAAQCLQNATTLPLNAPVFNPHLESPSIRKTAGIDHTKTKPVIRDAIGPPLPVSNSVAASRTNVVNPGVDQARRIGMPGMAASPLQNRNSYKPPLMKRPADPSVNQYVACSWSQHLLPYTVADPFSASRPALGDVTTASVNTPPDGLIAARDSKRQRVGDAPDDSNHSRVCPG